MTTAIWPVPPGRQLKPHQVEGVRFAVNRLRNHRGVLIADVMGLGKTAEAIVTANVLLDFDWRLLKPQRILVVCPKSVLLNWQQEIWQWQTLGLPVFLLRGGYPEGFSLKRGFWLVNYDAISNFPAIHDTTWDLLIVDESHKLKNPSAKRTQLVFGGNDHRAIEAHKALLLTGTPMVNAVHDIFTQLHFIDPDTWPSLDHFLWNHYDPDFIRVGDAVIGTARNLAWLRHQLSGVMIRRAKSVLGLPPKAREKVEVPIADDEVGAAFAVFLETEMGAIEKLQLILMSMFDNGYTAMDPEVLDLRQRIAGKVTVVRHRVGEYKVPFAVDFLLGIVEKTLVFAHHASVVEQLVEALKPRGAVWFTGQSSLEERRAAAMKFQTDPACQFFVGNIEASGTGITLTMASRVVFVELDWRGTFMEQASDRAHRIGQTRPVTVTYLLLEEASTDDWMESKAESKQCVIDEVLGFTDTPVSLALEVA